MKSHVSSDEASPPEHSKYSSTLQSKLQPSPLSVLPSSQYVSDTVPVVMLSPQKSEQLSSVDESPPSHLYPGSI
jgi:hypothetical protein